MSTVAPSQRVSDPLTAYAGQTDFEAGFPPPAQIDGAYAGLYIERRRGEAVTVLVVGTDFDVTGAVADNWSARLHVAAQAGDVLTIYGQAVESRRSTYQTGSLDSQALEAEFVRQAMRLQEHRRDIDRSPTVPFGENGPRLPGLIQRKNAGDGALLTTNPDTGDVEAVRSLVSFDQDVTDTANNATATFEHREAAEAAAGTATDAKDGAVAAAQAAQDLYDNEIQPLPGIVARKQNSIGLITLEMFGGDTGEEIGTGEDFERDTAAFMSAVAYAKGLGVPASIHLQAAKRYCLIECPPLPSEVTVEGNGAGIHLKRFEDFRPFVASYGSVPATTLYFGLRNEHWDVAVITDKNISIRNITFTAEDTDTEVWNGHGINMCGVDNFHASGIVTLGLADGVATLLCNNYLIEKCLAERADNCAWDCWKGCTNGTVRSCVDIDCQTAVNFNNILYDDTDEWISDGILIDGCTSVRAWNAAIFVAPLGSFGWVKNVVIRDHTFIGDGAAHSGIRPMIPIVIQATAGFAIERPVFKSFGSGPLIVVTETGYAGHPAKGSSNGSITLPRVEDCHTPDHFWFDIKGENIDIEPGTSVNSTGFGTIRAAHPSIRIKPHNLTGTTYGIVYTDPQTGDPVTPAANSDVTDAAFTFNRAVDAPVHYGPWGISAHYVVPFYASGKFSLTPNGPNDGLIVYAPGTGTAEVNGDTVTFTARGTGGISIGVNSAYIGGFTQFGLSLATGMSIDAPLFTGSWGLAGTHWLTPTFASGKLTITPNGTNDGLVLYAPGTGATELNGDTVTFTARGTGGISIGVNGSYIGGFTQYGLSIASGKNIDTPLLTGSWGLAGNHWLTPTYASGKLTITPNGTNDGLTIYAPGTGIAEVSGDTVTLTGRGTGGISVSVNSSFVGGWTQYGLSVPAGKVIDAPLFTGSWGLGSNYLIPTYASSKLTLTPNGANDGLVLYAPGTGSAVLNGSALSLVARSSSGISITVNSVFVGGITQYGMNLSTGLSYAVNGKPIIGDRQAGWAADTGTAKKTANATYVAPTFTVAPTVAEMNAMATALQNATQTIKALKDALIAEVAGFGPIGA